MCGWCWTHREASKHMRCPDILRAPVSPYHMHIPQNIQMHMEHWGIWGCLNIWGVFKHIGAYICPLSVKPSLPLRKSRKNLFKTKFLHLKSWKIKIREPPDCTGNEPTLDIPKGGSGQDIKMANTCHLSEHVDHETCSSPKYRKGGKKTKICLNAYL